MHQSGQMMPGSNKILSLLRRPACTGGLLVVTAVMMAVDGTWGIDLHHSWPFLLVIVLLMFSLGITVFSTPWQGTGRISILGHLGFLLILAGGFFGSVFFSDGQLLVNREEPAGIAVSQDGRSMPLPFGITLKDFTVDYYEDGTSPKQFTSVLDADGVQLTTSVNHPCRYKGYRIYQSGYDSQAGRYSIIKLVRDPWLPVVYLGMILLVLSAFLEIRRTWHSAAVVPVVLVLAAVFTIISMARINLGTMMPALRSYWFIPHLMVYMLAYSFMAVALVTAVARFFTGRIAPDVPRKFLTTSSSLLVIGMLCGAVWAKQAWGDYWTWDAKENWAAVTWLLTLVGTHLPRKAGRGVLAAVIALSFLAMQVTWYGVNYLPAAQTSLHTYNS